MPHVICPHCGRSKAVTAETLASIAGKKIRCECKAEFVVEERDPLDFLDAPAAPVMQPKMAPTLTKEQREAIAQQNVAANKANKSHTVASPLADALAKVVAWLFVALLVIPAASVWLRKTWPTWAIALGIFGWFVFAITSMSRAEHLLSYPCIAFVGAGITAHCLRQCTWLWTKLTGILLTVAAVYLWGHYDVYDDRWVHDNVRYTDTYKVWGGQHIYRDLYAFETPEAADKWLGMPIRSARGPIAGTGRFHGKWSYTYWKPFRVETKFFWYGEEISEGEWHLRNQTSFPIRRMTNQCTGASGTPRRIGKGVVWIERRTAITDTPIWVPSGVATPDR